MKNLIEINEEDPILRTFILFEQTARIVTKYQDTHMNKKTGLSDVNLIVLMAFFYDPSISITPSQIAQWTDTDPHNVTTLVNRMKRDGLLATKRDENDKRCVIITITKKGYETLLNSMPAAQEVIDRLFSSISREDALTLENILKVIRRNAYYGLEELNASE